MLRGGLIIFHLTKLSTQFSSTILIKQFCIYSVMTPVAIELARYNSNIVMLTTAVM